jgi:uncharacterized protein YcbK (DUF882 family)
VSVDRSHKLSPHYSLSEFLVDANFAELAAELDPPSGIVENLSRLTAVIEQICEQFPSKFEVLSGYRDTSLNDACIAAGLPASVNSLHLSGCAADIRAVSDEIELEEVFDWLEREADRLKLHEAVFYPKKDFIHVAVVDPENPSLKRILMRT